MDFVELLNSLLGEDAPNDQTVYDDLTAMYTDSVSLSDSANAKIAELEAANATLQEQVASLKAHNYDLLQEIGSAAGDPVDPADVQETGDIDEGDPSETITVDDLFTDGDNDNDEKEND